MAIRMSGLNSGLDTDAIVSALVSGYSFKKQKYQKAQTKLGWSQDAWKSLNTKVYSLYTNVSNLRFSSAYSLKKTTVSDNTKASVKASNTAVTGSQTLSISQVAQSGYLTGGKLKSSATSSTYLSQLGYTGTNGKINVDLGDGSSKEISISSSDTIGSVVNKLKNAGVNASFDETNNRFFVNSKETGADNNFYLTASNSEGTDALKKLGLYVDATAGTETYDNYQALADLADASKYGSSDVETNIRTALARYTSAQDTITNANKQISNLSTAADKYASAYAGYRDFQSKVAEAGITVANETEFEKLASMSASEKTNSLVDSDGNIYEKLGEDKDGNTIFGYKHKDSEGNEQIDYVIKNKEDGKYYEGSKVSKGYQDADGNVGVYSEDDDGKYYTVTKDGVDTVYKYDEASKTYKDEKGNTLEEKFDYPQGAEATSVKTAEDRYKEITEELKAAGIEESEYTQFGANVKTTNAMLDAVTADSDAAADNSVTSLYNQIVDAYENGYDGKTKTEAIESLKTSFYSEIGTLQDDIDDAQQIMEDNEIVKSLAGKSGDELEAAISSMVDKVAVAIDALSATNDGSYNSAIKVEGKDAIINLNGAEYKSSGNTFSINGLSITAQAVTYTENADGTRTDNPITITTNTDTQGIYDKIKDFLTEYNTLINEMTSLYNADRAKDYEPLTDEEKEQMSDKEIEKWEQKIKDSLLRHDSTLNNVMLAMTSAMAKSYTSSISGTKYSLNSFGISTLGFLNAANNENYAYHIDGDEDDTSTSGKTDKLMAMITSNPDDVMDFFQQLTTGLYDAIGKKMSQTSLSSVYTIYNDKQMQKEYDQYSKLIKEWEDKIATKEEYYYKKFSAMETSLSKLNSTQSSLSGYFS